VVSGQYAVRWVLAGVMGGAVVFAAWVAHEVPRRQLERATELYQKQQELLARQAAARIQGALAETARRLADPLVLRGSGLAEARSPAQLHEALRRLSRPEDERLGLLLYVTDGEGRTLAAHPEAPAPSVAILEEHRHAAPARGGAVSVCPVCLERLHAVSVQVPAGSGRRLTANLDIEVLAGAALRELGRVPGTETWLVAPDGRPVFSPGRHRMPSQGDPSFLQGRTALGDPASGWAMISAVPRAAVVEAVEADVAGIGRGAGGLLLGSVVGLLALFLRAYRESRREAEVARALASQEKLATVGLLSASLGHEIRNGLQILMSTLELVELEEVGHSGEPFEALRGPLKRVVELANDLAQLGGARTGESAVLELGDLARGALQMVRPRARGSAKLELTVEEEVEVLGVPGPLVQVVVNLVLNAVQAMEASGRHGEVLVQVWREGEAAVLAVHDDGPGFGPEVAGELFRPFFTTKPEGVGTGLGLYLSRAVVERFGGELVASSRVGEGSTFAMRLPVVAEGRDVRDLGLESQAA